MNAFMLPIILTAAFFLVGCEAIDDTPDTEQPDPLPPPANGGLSAAYADGVLTYSATIMIPTPCHDVRIEEYILESAPPQVRLTASFFQDDPDMVCIQVISEHTISGSITIGERPSVVTLTTPFETFEVTV